MPTNRNSLQIPATRLWSPSYPHCLLLLPPLTSALPPSGSLLHEVASPSDPYLAFSRIEPCSNSSTLGPSLLISTPTSAYSPESSPSFIQRPSLLYHLPFVPQSHHCLPPACSHHYNIHTFLVPKSKVMCKSLHNLIIVRYLTQVIILVIFSPIGIC